MNDYLKTKELYHHGIKGQKWGVRRYQNEDGTLTEEGLKKKEQYKQALNEELRKTTNNIALRNYSRYDHEATAYGVDEEANKRVAKSMKRGEELVKKMIKDGTFGRGEAGALRRKKAIGAAFVTAALAGSIGALMAGASSLGGSSRPESKKDD